MSKVHRTARNRFMAVVAYALQGALGFSAGCADTASDDRLCTPNAFSYCRCQNRDKGTKLCAPNGASFGECKKPGSVPCPGGESDETAGKNLTDEGENDITSSEPGTSSGSSGGSGPTATKAVCGNGVIEAPEACDDGNTRAEDGCNRYCSGVDAVPKGGTCPGHPVTITEYLRRVTVTGTLSPGAKGTFQPFMQSVTCRESATVGAGPSRIVYVEVTPRQTGKLSISVSTGPFPALFAVVGTCGNAQTVRACGDQVHGATVDVVADQPITLAIGGGMDPSPNFDAFSLTLMLRK